MPRYSRIQIRIGFIVVANVYVFLKLIISALFSKRNKVRT